MLYLLKFISVLVICTRPCYSKEDSPFQDILTIPNSDYADHKKQQETEEDIEYTKEPEIALKRAMDDFDTYNKNVHEKSGKGEAEALTDTAEIQSLHMADIARDLGELVRLDNNTLNFLKSKGFDRIIMPNLDNPNQKLIKYLLILIKNLLEMDSKATSAVMPISVIDILVNIFTKNSNLALKAYALDVLYVWLPWNPRIQMRVMKLSGLEPFYQQIEVLDASVIYTLLDLFHQILEEHLIVFNKKPNKVKTSPEKFKMYQKIGLLERMSTSPMCNALLQVFRQSMGYNTHDNNLCVPVFNLMENVFPLCRDKFNRSEDAAEVIDYMIKYVKDSKNAKVFKKINLDIDKVEKVLEDYRKNVNDVFDKEEL